MRNFFAIFAFVSLPFYLYTQEILLEKHIGLGLPIHERKAPDYGWEEVLDHLEEMKGKGITMEKMFKVNGKYFLSYYNKNTYKYYLLKFD